MRRVIIVQARMGSTRLPGKVMLDLGGRPMLARQIAHLQRCLLVDEIVIATTTDARDDILADLASQEGVRCFRGSEDDVLGRYLGAARMTSADVIARITGDCPLIDPAIVDGVFREALDHSSCCDNASNVIARTYPRGLDTEVVFFDALCRADRLATSSLAREHVTTFIYAERPDLFLIRSVTDTEDNSFLRWTVDTVEDFQAVRALFEELDLATRPRPYREVLAYARAHPELGRMNAGVATWQPPGMPGRAGAARRQDS